MYRAIRLIVISNHVPPPVHAHDGVVCSSSSSGYQVLEPNAMCLSTVDKNNRPSGRFVLLKVRLLPNSVRRGVRVTHSLTVM
jgi:hypothetical protein